MTLYLLLCGLVLALWLYRWRRARRAYTRLPIGTSMRRW